MKIYVAINSELHEGEDIEFFVLGTYTTKEQAMSILERQAKDDLNMFDDEDVESFDRHDFEDGHFTLTNGYDTYEYHIEEKNLNDEK